VRGQTRLIFKKEIKAEGRWDFRYTGIRETDRIRGIKKNS
jgi:hypothetical protein